jgi:hypothetical protein
MLLGLLIKKPNRPSVNAMGEIPSKIKAPAIMPMQAMS